MKRTNTAKWVESANRWQINVQKDGVRKTFTSAKPGRTGQREANAKADAWLEKGIQNRKQTVSEAYVQYMARQMKISSEGNWKPMQGRYNKWIAPRIGDTRLTSLTEQAVQDILDDAFAAGRSKKTIKNIAGDLRSFFKFCRRSGWTTFEPEELHVPEGARFKERTILQPTDIITLLNIDTTLSRGHRVFDEYIHYYRLAVFTGMRPGELLGLEWGDIEGGVARVKRSVNIYGKESRGKNENAPRAVILSARSLEELNAQKELTGMCQRVFPQVEERNIRRAWQRYCDANGITRCTLYELRHTFVSIAANLPTGQLKQVIGHSQNMDTYGVYAHAINGQDKVIAENIEGIFDAAIAAGKSTQ